MVPLRLRVGMTIALAALASLALAQDAHNIRIDPAGESTRAFLSYTDTAAQRNHQQENQPDPGDKQCLMVAQQNR